MFRFLTIFRYIVFFLVLFCVLISCSSGKNNHPYVLLISFDGFRWDYPDRNLTPNLSNFAANGVRAISLRPSFPTKTFPNHYSIITGLEPENHGIILNSFKNPVSGAEYRMSDTAAVRNPDWYHGEPIWSTLKNNGIKTASFFWPGSEVHDEKKRPDYVKYYNHNLPYEQRIDGIIEWLKLPENDRPHFLTLYFHETDSRGHEYGPDSKQIDSAIVLLDRYFAQLLAKLDLIGMRDHIDIIVASDHGMTTVSSEKIIDLGKIIPDDSYESWDSGPMMMIKPNTNNVYNQLKQNEEHFKVYKKSELPAHLHFSKHPSIYPLILIAEAGYSLASGKSLERIKNHPYSGNHGYDNQFLDMHGIFIAGGPHFKNAYKTGTIRNIDIYPLICKIFDVVPAPDIDGKLDCISYILRE